jgi:hypothetical protein
MFLLCLSLSSVACGLRHLIYHEKYLGNPNFCEACLLMDSYEVSCAEQGNQYINTLSGELQNTIEKHLDSADVTLTMSDNEGTYICLIHIEDIGPGDLKSFACSFVADNCKDETLVDDLTMTYSAECDFEGIIVNDGSNQVGSEEPGNKDQISIINVPSTWDCLPSPSMTGFWCEDYLQPDAGCSPPGPECLLDVFECSLDISKDEININYTRDVIHNMPRCFDPSGLGEYVEDGRTTEILGTAAWEGLKFSGIFPMNWERYGGEYSPELESGSTAVQVFGEYDPERVVIFMCLNLEVNEGISEFHESIVDDRSLCNQYFVCMPESNP